MTKTAFAAAVLAAGAFGLAAQPAFAEEEATTEAAAATALTIDSPIEALMANDMAAAILEKHFPGIGAHPAYEQFKGMSLVQLQPWSQGMITDENLAMVKAELEAIANA